jgi:hypothetical protein
MARYLLEYCPTKEMIADYFTKPLQGTLFKQLRDQIMNIDIANPLSTTASQDYRSVLEVVEEKPATDDGWTLVQRKTRHAMMTTNLSPDSMIRSTKKSILSNTNETANGVGVLSRSSTELKRLNAKVRWRANG